MRRRRVVIALAAVGLVATTARPDAYAASVPEAPSCPMFPSDSWWHSDIGQLPVHPMSSTYVTSMGVAKGVHADFGSGLWNGGPIGIPYVVVNGQPGVSVAFDYADESDQVAYPIPPNPPIEGGANSTGDRHVLIVDSGTCRLYELYAAYPDGSGGWTAGSGATWDLNSNMLRPDTWTSADAAGLPILPGLVRYDEVASGYIDHAIRVTASATQRSYVWPARHQAGTNNDALPPMGLRLRLRADFDISGFPPQDQVILQAMKTFGLVVADNGSSWYISGVPDERWDNDVLHALGQVPGQAFEAVDASSLMVNYDSGQAATGTAATPAAPAAPDPSSINTGAATTSIPAPTTAATEPSTLAIPFTPADTGTTDTTSSTTSSASATSNAAGGAVSIALPDLPGAHSGRSWWPLPALLAAIAAAAVLMAALLLRERLKIKR